MNNIIEVTIYTVVTGIGAGIFTLIGIFILMNAHEGGPDPEENIDIPNINHIEDEL